MQTTNAILPDLSIDVEEVIYVVLDIVVKSAFGLGLVAVHMKHSEDHAGTLPVSWTEPRAHRRIRLPVSSSCVCHAA